MYLMGIWPDMKSRLLFGRSPLFRVSVKESLLYMYTVSHACNCALCCIYFLCLRLEEVSEGVEKGAVEVDPMAVFLTAVRNAKPVIGTTRVTRGGKHYHVSLANLLHLLCLVSHFLCIL